GDPARLALRGCKPACVGYAEWADRVGLYIPDEDEGEAARVGEARAVDLEGPQGIHGLEVRGGESAGARVVLGHGQPERVREVGLGAGGTALDGGHLALLPGRDRLFIDPWGRDVAMEELEEGEIGRASGRDRGGG